MAAHYFDEIAACNRASALQTGELDFERVAEIIERALSAAPNRHAVILELAAFIACALDGSVVDPRFL